MNIFVKWTEMRGSGKYDEYSGWEKRIDVNRQGLVAGFVPGKAVVIVGDSLEEIKLNELTVTRTS